jgi:hypothetical protein
LNLPLDGYLFQLVEQIILLNLNIRYIKGRQLFSFRLGNIEYAGGLKENSFDFFFIFIVLYDWTRGKDSNGLLAFSNPSAHLLPGLKPRQQRCFRSGQGNQQAVSPRIFVEPGQ